MVFPLMLYHLAVFPPGLIKPSVLMRRAGMASAIGVGAQRSWTWLCALVLDGV